ncbi:translocation/assembly module TamB domain-containing protein [Pusillimonas sp. CC-YST705]|uniref:Translocation/assembly module TamB domain-containing protein n=1 Tax=Mesopusillimonas faecipullorum TaxID=2755040 RepID=A0ABS8CCS6_9BURK|nr:translocation/assembly module TamB domain-containing protein [Mesopusillimonas faecipullorum]MCB5363841.1 translocation/assembly module TamB domain-containing protein [Mesopusillimonas faecipullorum]
MSRRKSHWLRRLLLWWLPLMVLPIMIVAAFIIWCLSSQAGTRWALTTGASVAGVQMQGVSGTVWKGVKVARLRMDEPTLGLALDDLVLQVNWPALLDRHLHVRELSAGRVAVDLRPQPETEPSSEEGFSLPELPVSLTLERFSLGDFELTQENKPLLGARRVLASLAAQRNGQGLLTLRDGTVLYDTMQAQLGGQLTLHQAGGAWPMSAHFDVTATAQDATAPICVSQYLPDLHQAQEGADELASNCALTATLDAEGSLETLQLKAQAQGQGLKADLDAHLLPQASFPLRSGQANISLADGSRLLANLDYQAGQEGALDKVDASVQLEKLDLQAVGGETLPQAGLTGKLEASAHLTSQGWPQDVAVKADFAPDSSWLGQPLRLQADIQAVLPTEMPEQWWAGLQLDRLNIDAQIARNRVHTEGGLGHGEHRLVLDVDAPQLEQFWPGLPGGVTTKGWVSGNLAQHQADLSATYFMQEDADPDALGEGPVQLQVALHGGWGPLGAESEAAQGWQGQVSKLAVHHAGSSIETQSPLSALVRPEADGAMAWRVGAFGAQVVLPGLQPFNIAHTVSEGAGKDIHTQGAIPRLALTRAALRQLQETWMPEQGDSRGRVIVAHSQALDNIPLVFGADWNLRMADSITGALNVRRLEGDLVVPVEQPFPLELTELQLAVQARAAGDGNSRIAATVTVASSIMGNVRATGNALLRRKADGGWEVRDSDPVTFEANADLHNLSWISLVTGDSLEIDGQIQADLRGSLLPGGKWDTTGTITGDKLRIVRIDDGVRLLDGTLRGRFEGSRVVLESLRFPAVLRVTPKEWRTDEWVRTNPEAQGGYLDLNGSWDLDDFQGGIAIDFYRYPILQRSDRYAMISGQLKVDVPYPTVALTGKLNVDAGWIDLDMLSSVPTLDSDVVVLRTRNEVRKEAVPMDVTMDLEVDLGPRFYITGYGVNSGLVGDLHLFMAGGRLTAEGVLRTRGGAISAYGQRLQLRQGTITFQGDITSPILSIEALRTGQAVQAGVRVTGTPRRPRITLISYPEVSEVEKLSWLLLGRGPDESGGDAALLFSVGTSFLGDGEAFYRRFGVDDVTMRTGELGSSGSVLPPESVVRGFDSGTSDIERKFVVASKHITTDLTASVEQALSDTGTVGRLAYRLARGLSAQLTVGTINGAALIYRGSSD